MKGTKHSIGFKYAINGIKEVIKQERNFRIHLVMAIFVILFSFLIGLNMVEWAVILLVIGIVLAMEIINSAIERIIDYIKPEIHPQAKLIKDMAAGGVLVAAFLAVVIAGVIFIPKIIEAIQPLA